MSSNVTANTANPFAQSATDNVDFVLDVVQLSYSTALLPVQPDRMDLITKCNGAILVSNVAYFTLNLNIQLFLVQNSPTDWMLPFIECTDSNATILSTSGCFRCSA